MRMIIARRRAGFRTPGFGVATRTCAHPNNGARYVLGVPEDPITEELKVTQLEREQAERERARSVLDEDEAAQHERRADKAKYLADKLEKRAESERRRDD
jgi:hypothetical protein